MEIKAQDVKALRERTGAGMMECKNALVQTKGDAKEAEKLLKEKGLAAVEKRAGRATQEGKIFIQNNETHVVICEVTCETDFVSKNAEFIEIGNNIAKKALENKMTEITDDLSNMLLGLATKIRENMKITRLALIDIPANAIFSSYIHSDGKTGVVAIVSADPASAKNTETVKEFAYDCCLHVAAFNPPYIRREDVPASEIDELKEIFTKQTAELDKPEKVKEGIVNGKINKHYAEVCFLEQAFVKDDKMTVAKKIEAVGKEVDAKLNIEKVVSYVLGA